MRVCGAYILHVCIRTRRLMPHVFFAFAHASHTRVPFNLLVIGLYNVKNGWVV